ncbi:hypothetical protein M0805_002879 [Coniferiporia weirii]|nr:hypothetical protein M0805_002879 [Coniferiporia weirii]
MLSHLRLLNDTVIIGPGDLANEVFNDQIQLFARVSATTLLAYDIVITMDKEVKYFWKTPFTPISFLYFLNRYLGLLEALVGVRSFTLGVTEALYVPSNDNDLNNTDLVRQVYILQYVYAAPILLVTPVHRWFLGMVLSDFWCVLLALQSSHSDSHSLHFPGWIGILAIDAILLIKVIALYERGRKLTVCLSSLFVAEAAVMLWFSVRTQLDMGIGISTVGTSFAGIGNAAECGITLDTPQLMFVLYWYGILLHSLYTGQLSTHAYVRAHRIPPTVFELILLVLSVRKGAEFWRLTAGLKGFKLMHVLIRDQVVYFALVLACGVANVILIYVDEGVLTAGGIFTNATAPCILGSRILVNLRDAAGQNVYASGRSRSGSENGAVVLSDMRFA